MRGIFLLAVFMLVYGCAQAETTYSTYEKGGLTFEYPDWPDADLTDQNFLVKNNGRCVFAASEYPVPSAMLKDTLQDELDSEFEGEYINFTIAPNTEEFDARTRVMYCDYQTYALTMACLDGLDDTSFFSRAECEKREMETKPKLGMIPYPADDDPSLLVPAFRESRENGVEVLYWYLKWKDLDSNWTVADWVMEPLSYEGKTAVVVGVIHTNVLGEYPSRYSSFDDPGFKEDFAEFSAEFVKRYKPDYYFVGNEVDDYLWNHRDKLPAFKELLSQTRDRIKEESPSTKVGFTTTYHDALTHNATGIIVELSDEADLIGYTCYGYHGTFVFDNVSKGLAYLDELETVVPGKPFAVVEAGWSSSTLLESSEEKQKEYAEGFFEYLETTDAEFVNWFALHDGVDCTEGAESFLVDMPEMKENDEFMVPFKEFLCSLGIQNSDGTPKKAWQTWQDKT